MMRALIRAAVPLGLRISVRRIPALARDLWVDPPARLERGARDDFGHLQAERTTPLHRDTAPYGPAVQAAKEVNVSLAASLIDGTVIPPGGTFSWHRSVGPPLRRRGFQPGPELHDGKLESGDGGGLCQVANLVFWLALHSGMSITERHRHALDLFPDHERTAPFGCGATVFYPHLNLRFTNPLDQPLLLELDVAGGFLHGRARLVRDAGLRFTLAERNHRFVRSGGAVYRENRLFRVRHAPDGGALEEWLADNRARVLYEVDAAQIEVEEKR